MSLTTNPTRRRRFILKLVRMQNAIEASNDAWGETYSQDSEFDGGEFSGPAIAKQMARDEREIVARFGFTDPEWAWTAVGLMRCHTIVQAHHYFGGPMPLPR